MAQFKLYLLTPALSSDLSMVKFLKTTISEFSSQQILQREKSIKQYDTPTLSQDNVYCYSFNEKISLHTNGQKELSFSMLRKVWVGDSLVNNPFIGQLHNGTQILLVDKYNNQFFFTIKNISYKLGSSNITYDFSCQDSFTYQAIRQNDGYTIENNINSSDFIGAKTVDWWVLNKIQPDCHLMYQYASLNEGVYLVDDGFGANVVISKKQPKRVKKILKQPYTEESHDSYYEKIPFSISGSNCSAALIALGEELGLSLNFCEHELQSNLFFRCFWFEPKKNEDNANLKYSPFSSIQSFGFTQAGDSLTTVLNIESNTIDEEVISLIPSPTPFFTSLIENTKWNNDKYSKGFFTSVCQETTTVVIDGASAEGVSYDSQYELRSEVEEEGDGEGEKKTKNIVYIKLKSKTVDSFQIPSYYDYIDFNTSEKESFIYFSSDTKKKRYTPLTSTSWSFIERIEVSRDEAIEKIGDKEVYKKGFYEFEEKYYQDVEYNNTFSPIPKEKRGTSINAYIRVVIDEKFESDLQTIDQSQIVLHFYRDALEEDLEFAKIADECPWLENKLIDFQYFVDQQIISKSELQELTNILQNDLRIVNGLLMIYSAQYYQALHSKTKLLANLTSDLDSLGAAFHADVVDFYAKNGSIRDYSYFSSAYDVILNRYLKNENTESLLNYEDILTEYLNKYFNAQQRFLKNIYNFSEYFNSNACDGSESVWRHVITLTSPEPSFKQRVYNNQFEEDVEDWLRFPIAGTHYENAITYDSFLKGIRFIYKYTPTAASKTYKLPNCRDITIKTVFQVIDGLPPNIQMDLIIENKSYKIYNYDVTQAKTEAIVELSKVDVLKSVSYEGKEVKVVITITPPSGTGAGTIRSFQTLRQSEELNYISFTNYKYNAINSSFDLYDKETYEPFSNIYTTKNKEIVGVIHGVNYADYYIPSIKTNDYIESRNYNYAKTYHRLEYRVDKNMNLKEVSVAIDDQYTVTLLLNHSDDEYNYYCFLTPYATIIPLLLEKYSTIDNIPGTLDYEHNSVSYKFEKCIEPVALNEIISEYLWREGLKGNSEYDQWTYHSTDTFESVGKWLSYPGESGSGWNWVCNINPKVWVGLLSPGQEGSDEYNIFTSKTPSWDEIKKQVKKYYAEKFPITTINFTGPKYTNTPFYYYYTENNGKSIENKILVTQHQRINKDGQTVSDYIDWWTRTNQSNPETLDEIENPTTYTTSVSIPLVTPSNEATYYRRVVKNPGFVGHALNIETSDIIHNTLGGMAIGLCGGVVGAIVGGIVGGISSGLSSLYARTCHDLNLWSDWETCWDTSGYNTQNFTGAALKTTYSGYIVDPKLEDGTITDVYATSPTAYKQYKEITEDCKYNFIGRLETSTTPGVIGVPLTIDTNKNIYFTNSLQISSGERTSGEQIYLINKTTNLAAQEQFFNFYSLRGLTYYAAVKKAKEGAKLTYKENYWRLLSSDDIINKNFKYKIILQSRSEQEPNLYNLNDFIPELIQDSADTDSPGRIFINKYYFLRSIASDLDFSTLDIGKNTTTLKNALTNAGYTNIADSENPYLITAHFVDSTSEDNEETEVSFFIVQEEDFKRERCLMSDDFSTNYINKRFKTYDGRIVYNEKQQEEVNFLNIEGLTLGFFEKADADSHFVEITEKPTDWLENRFYHKNASGDYVRIYSIPQIMKNGGYSYVKSNSTTIENLTETPKLLEAPVYLHEELWSDSKLESNIITHLEVPLSFLDENNTTTTIVEETENYRLTKNEITFNYKGKIFSTVFSIESSKLYDIGKMTKGEFWYLYNNRSDTPILQKKAALIASQLTQYWSAALSASKYCEFFIPDSWMAKVDGYSNYFAASIIKVGEKNTTSGNSGVKLSLSNKFIPVVKVYTEGRTSKIPKYSLSYKKATPLTEDTKKKEINQVVSQKASSDFKNNIVFANALNALGENINNIYFEQNLSASDILKTTYYYSTTGGMKWSDLLQSVCNGASSFEFYSGLYVMTYKILKQFFREDHSVQNYYEYKNKHKKIWDNLYKNFPGIILENVYSNESATTSLDLYTVAKNAFKDLSYPEKGYNISIIDLKGLEGYEGQEVKIGDAILVNVDEFYDEYDYIYKSLSQYLFITDISYDLRRDDNVALTVNSIKYQDKLIQRLVKLIK